MDANEPDFVPDLIHHSGEAAAPRPGLLRSSWHGAKTGFRLMSYIAGPIAAVALILVMAVAAIGLGAGHGFWVSAKYMIAPLVFFLECALCGALVGALIGPTRALVGRASPARQSPESDAAAPSRLVRPRRHPWRWIWLVVGPGLVVFVVAFGFGVYLRTTVDGRLASAIAVADQDDPFWRLDDLLAHRDHVPDAENSALVVDEALAHLPKNWPPRDESKAELSKSHSTKEKGFFDRLTATPYNVRLDDPLAQELRGALKAHHEAVRIARTIADYAHGRHELKLGPAILDTPLPETQEARSVARLLAVDAAIRADDGDCDGALDSCRAVLGTGRSIGDEPFLISQLVRAGIGITAIKATLRTLGQGEPSDHALAGIQSLVLDELSQPLLLHGLKGERAMITELIRRVGAGELPVRSISFAKLDSNGPLAPTAPWGKLLYQYQQSAALEWMNEAVAIARRPVSDRQRLWDEWKANVDHVKRSWYGKYTSTVPLLMTPAVSAFCSTELRYQSELGATAILLAAERYRRNTGDWPASIAAIDQSLLPISPVDPCSGQPFRIERRDGQLFIYSVGLNGLDEHAGFDAKQWLRGQRDDFGASTWDVNLRRQPPTP
jgi:hypothetical protein